MTNLDSTVMDEIEYSTFLKIISKIPSCIFYKDKDLKYRFSSHCWMQLISDDIVGKTDLEIRKDKDNAMKAMEADREILRSKKGCSYIIKSEIDGVISYLELIKEPILDDSGEAIGIVGLINDVTEKTLMEQQIAEMTKKLENQCRELENSNNELKQTLEKVEELYASNKLFTASMNHELRSPLNGIIGLLQLMREDESLSEQNRENVHNAYQSSKLMLSIVNELLDLAKMETNEFTVKKEVFSLKEILDNISFVFKKQAEDKNLDFQVIVEENIEDKFIGDENRIKQIMHNFVSNAIKYSDEGSIRLEISHADNMLEISCSDTGQGMSEESLEKLFDPYVRFNEKKNANIQGTGLGLSVVKKIIDKMEGEIDVESELNKGTKFIARIPVSICDDKEEKTISFNGLRALCVDDSKVNVKVLAALLDKYGMIADKAYSAAEAIKLCDEVEYDIIFMDHLMPEMDGIEAFNAIRNNSKKNINTPIIMLTGNADSSYADFYKEAGTDGYLIKPIEKEKLVETIKNTHRP